jgi:hypothetical protein
MPYKDLKKRRECNRLAMWRANERLAWVVLGRNEHVAREDGLSVVSEDSLRSPKFIVLLHGVRREEFLNAESGLVA